VNALLIRSVITLITITFLIISGSTSLDVSGEEANDAVDRATVWLLDQQLDNGGFPGFDGESDPGATADAILALAVANRAGLETSDEIAEAIAYLESEVDDYSVTQGGAAKMLLAVNAAGTEPRDFGGLDLIEIIEEHADDETGMYDQQIYVHATTMLAIGGAGEEILEGAAEFLVERQIDDGSWAFTGDTTSGEGDTNTTSIAMRALAASDNTSEDAIEAAVAYLDSAQLDDGSIVYAVDAEDPPLGDSNSTALAIEGWIAAGIKPDDERIQRAADALLAFQNESGAFGYRADMPDDSALSTSQSIPALAVVTGLTSPAEVSSEAGIPTPTVDPDETRVGLMVHFDDDVIEYHVIDLNEVGDASGLELLDEVGYELEVEPFAGLGEAVCAINDTGCPASDCFCESYSSPAVFWQFLIVAGDQVIPQHEGAGQHTSSPGEVQVWAWTDDTSDLPAITFDELIEEVETTLASDDDSSMTPEASSGTESDQDDSLSNATIEEGSTEQDDGWTAAQYAQLTGLVLVLVGIIAFVGIRKIRNGNQT
jgi:hypothetical protein